MEKFMQHSVAQMQQSGTSQAEIERQTTEMMRMKEMYEKPLIKFGLTFLEAFSCWLFGIVDHGRGVEKTGSLMLH